MARLEQFTKNAKIGYKNRAGEIVIAPEYDDGCLYYGQDGFYGSPYGSVCKDGKCGIIDEEGKVVVPLEYQEAYHLFDDLFAVRKPDGEYNESWVFGVVNAAGEVIVPYMYKFITSEGYFIKCCDSAKSKRKYSFQLMDTGGYVYEYSQSSGETWFNRQGKIIYEGDGVESRQGYLVIEKDEHLGLVDQQGNEVLPPEYDEIRCINKELVVARKNIDNDWRFGVIKLGKGILIPFDYKYIETNSEFFIECYKQCESERHFPLSANHRYEYSSKQAQDWYNQDGQIVFSGKGRIINSDVLAVEKNGLWGAYNQKKKRIVNFLYDDIFAANGNLIVGKDTKIGVLNSSGEVIISPSYQRIECVNIVHDTYVGFFSEKTYGDYAKEHVFDSESPAKSLYRIMAYYGEGYKQPRLYIRGSDDFKWDNTFILSNGDYSELFTIKDGIIPESRFDSIFHITPSSYMVKQNDNWGVFSSEEQELIIPCEYDRIIYEGGYVALLCKDALWGAKTLLPPSSPIYSILYVDIPVRFLEIKILDTLQRKYGVKYEYQNYKGDTEIRYKIVDSNGEQIGGMRDLIDTDSQFEWYSNERILSSRNGKWGFLSLRGYDSIPFKYDLVEARPDGNFDVQFEDMWGVLDLTGKEIVAIKYRNRIPQSIKSAVVQDSFSGRFGVLSEDGKELVPAIHEHLFIRGDFIFFGYGGCLGNNFFSDVDNATWGCMDLSGNQIIPPKYRCYIIKDRFILAGRDGSFGGRSDQEYQDKFCGVYDLYTRTGELLFGGFDKLKVYGNYFFFLLNGEWESYIAYQDDWNNIQDEDVRLDEENAMWLPLDASLLSVKLGKDGKRVQFRKGFLAKIRKEKKDNHITNYYNLDIKTLVKDEPAISGDYMLTKGDERSQAIRLSDGKASDVYDEIQLYEDNLFFVRKNEKVGVVSFDNEVILPLDYFALTNPVSGYVFAFKELENSLCSVDLVYVVENKVMVQNVIANKERKDVVDDILYGMFIITILPNKTGLKAIGLFRPSIFDEGFAKQIDGNQHGEFYSKHKIHYWFSNNYSLQESDDDYDYGGYDD